MVNRNQKQRVLGQDFVVLKGRGQRDIHNGATVEGDSLMHLGHSLEQRTTCGKSIKEFLLTNSDVEIDCPDCIKTLKKGK